MTALPLFLSRAMPLLVAALTTAAFIPVLSAGFVNWDDDKMFLLDAHYRSLTWTNVRWMFTTVHMSNFMPLSWMSYWLDYRLWGMNPAGYHLTSLLLHCACAVVFYFICARLLRLAAPAAAKEYGPDADLAAGFAALLFSVHPLRVESVAWLADRHDLLSGLFFLLTIHFYLRACAAADQRRDRRRLLAVSTAAYACSLLSKASGVTLPVVLVILDAYPLRRPFVRHWKEKIPYLLLAVPAGLAGLYAKRATGSPLLLDESVLTRAAHVLYAAAFYPWKTLLPFRLLPFYGTSPGESVWTLPYLLSAAAVLGASVFFFLGRRARPAPLAVWICYLTTLFPVSGALKFGAHIAADRYSYLPCLGFAALGGAAALRASNRGAARLTAGLILAALAGLTWRQSTVWRDSESLWRHTLSIAPGFADAQGNLAVVLADSGRLDEALPHYREALRLKPGAEVHFNLANLLSRLGRLDEAVGHYQAAIELKPGFPDAHNNLGNVLNQAGRRPEAISHFREALKINPDYAEAHHNLGNALNRRGSTDEALFHYREALRIRPDLAQTRAIMDATLAGMRRRN